MFTWQQPATGQEVWVRTSVSRTHIPPHTPGCLSRMAERERYAGGGRACPPLFLMPLPFTLLVLSLVSCVSPPVPTASWVWYQRKPPCCRPCSSGSSVQLRRCFRVTGTLTASSVVRVSLQNRHHHIGTGSGTQPVLVNPNRVLSGARWRWLSERPNET